MTPGTRQRTGTRGDDIVAAEYVLGVLAADERAAAPRRIDAEPVSPGLSTAGKVYLSPLAAAYLPVEPPASLKAAIDRRLFASAASRRGRHRPACGRACAFWRRLALPRLSRRW